jgi:hypothetical protein
MEKIDQSESTASNKELYELISFYLDSVQKNSSDITTRLIIENRLNNIIKTSNIGQITNVIVNAMKFHFDKHAINPNLGLNVSENP